jgi:hypothetical protein
MAGFAHLHVHSHFSFMDGAAALEALLARAAGYGMGTLALTDHQGLYGAIRFYRAALKTGIKPIVGVEIVIEAAGLEKGATIEGRSVSGALRARDSISRCWQKTSPGTATSAGCFRARTSVPAMSHRSCPSPIWSASARDSSVFRAVRAARRVRRCLPGSAGVPRPHSGA